MATSLIGSWETFSTVPCRTFPPDSNTRKFGPFTEKWIRAELGRFKYEVQAYRPATTVLRLLNRHSSVAERTSEIAIESNIFTVKGFRSILSAQERKHVEETAPEPDLNSLFCSHDGEVSG